MSDPFAPFTPYDADLAGKILRAVGRGLSLREVCAHDGMPSAGDVLEWADTDPDFAERLRKARSRGAELRLEALVDEIRNPPEALKPTTVAEHQRHMRLVYTVTRLLLSLHDPARFGKIRGPSLGGEPRQPTPSPAVGHVGDPANSERAETRAPAFKTRVSDALADIARGESPSDANLSTETAPRAPTPRPISNRTSRLIAKREAKAARRRQAPELGGRVSATTGGP